MVVHMLLAAKVSPRMAMKQDEANQLATAVCNYLRHTKVKVDAKTRDFWTLLFVIATVEGTRLLAMINDKSVEAKARKAAALHTGPNVVHLDPQHSFVP